MKNTRKVQIPKNCIWTWYALQYSTVKNKIIKKLIQHPLHIWSDFITVYSTITVSWSPDTRLDISPGSHFSVLQTCSSHKMVTNKIWQSHVWRCTTCATVYCTSRRVKFPSSNVLVLYCNYTVSKPMYIIRSALSVVRMQILIGVISFAT